MKKINITLLFFVLCWLTGCTDKENTELMQVSSIELESESANSIIVKLDESVQVKVKALPESAVDRSQYTNYIYRGDDDEIFTVDAKGTITGNKVGDAFLHVKSVYNPEIVMVVSVRVVPLKAESIVLPTGINEFRVGVDSLVNIASLFSVLPEKALDKTLAYRSETPGIVSVDAEGNLKGVSAGAGRITVSSATEPDVSRQFEVRVGVPSSFTPLDRNGWSVETSHETTLEGPWPNLLDGKGSTFMALIKPGKNYDDIVVPKDDAVWFTVDMKASRKFSAILLTHRDFVYTYLRVQGISVYGSNDGEEFLPLLLNAPIEYDPRALLDVRVPLPAEFEYRYLKITMDKWDEGNGASMQIAEFYAGSLEYEN